MTGREWLKTYSDLDAYIAAGGKLLDLEIVPNISDALIEALGPEKLDRIGRYFSLIGKRGGKQKVGDVLSEDELRAIWRETDLTRN